MQTGRIYTSICRDKQCRQGGYILVYVGTNNADREDIYYILEGGKRETEGDMETGEGVLVLTMVVKCKSNRDDRCWIGFLTSKQSM